MACLAIHSDFDFPSSHDQGVSSLSEILSFAQANRYEYLGLSDHNPKFVGLTEKQKMDILIRRRKYLESQFKPEMNWDNHKIIWEIEHHWDEDENTIRMLRLFNDDELIDIFKCVFSYEHFFSEIIENITNIMLNTYNMQPSKLKELYSLVENKNVNTYIQNNMC
jgi:hypothetical protein